MMMRFIRGCDGNCLTTKLQQALVDVPINFFFTRPYERNIYIFSRVTRQHKTVCKLKLIFISFQH